ncbi:uncharacterized hydrolase YNR064C isoform X2 [Cryptomeria japonica]|uniref:uncharacterized hydrolase YNR064C isoform X2 n=1 Tax=Cryptomeria japonica TaxID=3369 RepID=UPI0025AD475A|nr:uncharacterized hydrolase YNR064C isoform X2 [Cryptomeria japonica]
MAGVLFSGCKYSAISMHAIQIHLKKCLLLPAYSNKFGGSEMISARQKIQCQPCALPSSALGNFHFPSKLPPQFSPNWRFKQLKWKALSTNDDDEGYLVDAPVMVGDGFSFGGGKYSDMPSKADEWFQQGKLIKAYSIGGGITKAKDPIFGLEMGQSSQVEDNAFRWFCVEAGDTRNPSIVLIHGLPSQAYSFRKVIPMLSQDYHVIAFDWLGFGFSDKPQPKYGFDYTMNEYKVSLGSLLEVLGIKDVTLVSQGYFAPIVVDYARTHQDNLKKLILINPPLTEQHAKLPSSLSSFSNFLLGEIFSQDPLRASDKLITSCGPYLMDEEDAMVYRRPYLTSGSSGFALTAISRVMKKEIKELINELRSILASKEWKVSTTIIWGMRDRWLNYDGVEKYMKSTNHELIQLRKAGHHAQEDYGEEVGEVIRKVLKGRM